MKKILITGANSYIGTSFEKYILQWNNDFSVDTIDLIDESWIKKDFSIYDIVYHVAGIAHSDNGKITKEKEKLYRSVNTDLTIKVATKAKNEGVKQFIFMSSAIVFGNSAKIGKQKCIDEKSTYNPFNCYGDSKVQAELGIIPLSCPTFKVCILRPPMIYGKGSKGNFPQLEKFANLPFFPYVKNQRSMLYIGNLVEFVRLMIVNEEEGIFYPQNKEYSNTSEIVSMIAKSKGKKICLIHGFSWLLKIVGIFTKMVDKAFGSFVYSQDISNYKEEYRLYSLEESIELTEK